MRRVLLGQDGGDGFGHAARLAPIADALRRHGVEVQLALRAPATAKPILEPLGLEAIQAPMARVPHRPDLAGHITVSYVDLMAIYSLDRPAHLAGLIAGWDRIMGDFRPDLVIADFAPALALAAHGAVPVVHVGSGYTVPPADGEHFPPLRDRQGDRQGDRPGDLPGGLPEAPMLASFNEVQRRRRRPPLAGLTELLRGAATFVTCLPLLDAYAATRPSPALGPLRPLPAPVASPPATDYFAYLAADHAGSLTMLEGLLASRRMGSAYLRNADPALCHAWRRRGLVIHEAPQPMHQAAGRAALVVHHGGINTTETVLALGRPQLFVPRHAEQMLTSQAVMRAGAGVRMRGKGKFLPQHVVAALDSIGRDETVQAAKDLAQRIAVDGPYHGLERIAATCLELLRDARST